MVPQCYASHGPPCRRITSRQNPVVARYRAVAQGDVDGLSAARRRRISSHDALAAGLTIQHARRRHRRDASADDSRTAAGDVAGGRRRDRKRHRSGDGGAQPGPLAEPRSSRSRAARRDAGGRLPRAGAARRHRLRRSGSRQPRRDRPRRRGRRRHRVSSLPAQSPTRSAGKRCAGRWAARFGFRSQRVDDAAVAVARCATRRLPHRRHRAARRTVAVRRRSAAARSPCSSAAKGQGCRDALVDAADERVTIPMQPPVESLNAAVTRRARRLRSAQRQRQHRVNSLFPDEAPPAGDAARGAARRADAAAHLRRVRRPGRAARAGQAAARGHRARPAAVDHPLGAARHRQDHAGAHHRGHDARRGSCPSAPCWPASRKSARS